VLCHGQMCEIGNLEVWEYVIGMELARFVVCCSTMRKIKHDELYSRIVYQ